MKKSDLRSGMIVQLRDGNKYIVLLGCRTYGCITNMLVSISKRIYLDLKNYNEEMIRIDDASRYNIVKVCDCDHVADNIYSHICGKDTDLWTWERPIPKKMTLAEVSEALGYDVEIVG